MDFLRDQRHRFYAVVASASELDSYLAGLQLATRPNAVVRVLPGRRMRSKELLLDEFAEALQFPSYFGRNWDAFEECMADLRWLRGKDYILIISDAGSLLKIEPENDFVILFKILEQVSREWAEGKLPDPNAEQEPVHFHFLLQDDGANIEDLRHALIPVVGDVPVIGEDMH